MGTVWSSRHLTDRRQNERRETPYDLTMLQVISFILGVVLLLALGFLVYFGG